jgi:hypothetical protein
MVYILEAGCLLFFLFLLLIFFQKRKLFNKFSPLFDPIAIFVAVLFGIYSLNHAKEELESSQKEMKGLNNTLRTIVETATTSKTALQNVNNSLSNVSTQLDTFSFSIKDIATLSNSQLQIWKEQQLEYQRRPSFYISFKSKTISDSVILLEDPVLLNKGNIEATLKKVYFYSKNYISSSYQLFMDSGYYCFWGDLDKPKVVLGPDDDYTLPYKVIELKNKDTKLFYKITFESMYYHKPLYGLLTFPNKNIKIKLLNENEWVQYIHKR